MYHARWSKVEFPKVEDYKLVGGPFVSISYRRISLIFTDQKFKSVQLVFQNRPTSGELVKQFANKDLNTPSNSFLIETVFPPFNALSYSNRKYFYIFSVTLINEFDEKISFEYNELPEVLKDLVITISR
jgi:hypothetical protein